MNEEQCQLIARIAERSIEIFELNADLGSDSLLTLIENNADLLTQGNDLVLAIGDEIYLAFKIQTSNLRVELSILRGSTHNNFVAKNNWEKVIHAEFTTINVSKYGPLIINNAITLDSSSLAQFSSNEDKSSNLFEETITFEEEADESQNNKDHIEQPKAVHEPTEGEKKTCPHCHRIMTESDLDDCPFCEETIFTCPRCQQYIENDPAALYECPNCDKSLTEQYCPHCGESDNVFTDLEVCSHCGKELKHSKCPHCEKMLIFNDDQEECPFCEETIFTCPRCQQYIENDPDDLNECPNCDKSLTEQYCPHCGENDNVFTDLEVCPHCGKELKHSKCPYCEKMLIFSEAVHECPSCQMDLNHATCPDCDKHFYTEG
ncbi:MAG: hypothetical protein ABH884_00400 [Candidatus Komeilibacteria bacterium]